MVKPKSKRIRQGLNKKTMQLVTLSDTPGFGGARFPYDAGMIERMKLWPGAQYADEYGKGVWAVPNDPISVAYLKRCCDAYGWAFKDLQEKSKVLHRTPRTVPKYLIGYQGAAAKRIVKERRILLAFDPGLGKTITAMVACDLAKCGRIIVICPAIARPVWAAEKLKWGIKGGMYVVNKGKDLDTVPASARWLVTSYQMAKGIRMDHGPFDAVIVDESHMCKDDRTKQYGSVWYIFNNLLASDESLRVLLTGTPVTKEPPDFRAQGNLLYGPTPHKRASSYPTGRYGWHTQFGKRFCNAIPDEYAPCGFRYEGMNEEHEEELLGRINQVMIRVTADEVADKLPPLSTSVLRIKPKRKFKHREVAELFKGDKRQHEERMTAHATRTAESKITFALKWVKESFEEGNKRLVLFTQLRQTAREIVEFSPELATLVSGDVPAKKRTEIIADLHGDDACVAVCTMDSVGVAIDLTFADKLLFVELPWTPGQLDQVFRRCYRLSRSMSRRLIMQFLVAQGSGDELLIHTLSNRLRAFNKVQRASVSQQQWETALIDSGESEDEFLDRLADIAASADEELSELEGYLE